MEVSYETHHELSQVADLRDDLSKIVGIGFNSHIAALSLASPAPKWLPPVLRLGKCYGYESESFDSRGEY